MQSFKRCLLAFLAFLIFNSLHSQTSPANETTFFAKGFDEGFKAGYCYNHEQVDCHSPLTPLAPLPRVNENPDNYQDGYNRGFQIGLDLQRLDNGGAAISPLGSSNPNNYRFNDYIPQIPIDEISNVLLYKQALFEKRRKWVQKRIDELYDLSYSLLDSNGYQYIKNIILEYGNSFKVKAKSESDLADNKVISTIANTLNNIQNEIYRKYKKELDNAYTDTTQKDFDGLIQEIQDSLRTNPKYSLALAEKCEAMHVDDTSIFILKGQIYEKLSNFEMAIKYNDLAYNSIKNYPSLLVGFYLTKSRLLLENKKPGEALSLLNAPSLAANADDSFKVAILIDKSYCYFDLKQYYSAIKSIDEFLNSPFSKVYYNLVIPLMELKTKSLKELGQFSDALKVITSAIEQNNDKPMANLFAIRGIVYFKMNNYSEALNDLIRSTVLNDSDAEALYYLGRSYKILKQTNKACPILKKAAKLGNAEALEEYPRACK